MMIHDGIDVSRTALGSTVCTRTVTRTASDSAMAVEVLVLGKVVLS